MQVKEYMSTLIKVDDNLTEEELINYLIDSHSRQRNLIKEYQEIIKEMVSEKRKIKTKRGKIARVI